VQTEPSLAEDYRRQGWWSRESASEILRRRAAAQADGVAYIEAERQWTWSEYDALADEVAALLAGLGINPGDRVAVHLPDGAMQHASFVATERIGVIAVGVPGRADDREVAQLATRSGARVLVMTDDQRGRDPHATAEALRELGAPLEHHLVLRADGSHEARTWRDGVAVAGPPPAVVPPTSALAPEDVWMLNFTSGTTGLPKAVQQTQNRWYYLASEAGRAARITGDDRVLCAVPGPYGFGIWTGHMLPLIHGIPCCLTTRFSPDETLRMLERHRISVLACVTTQLVMMMNSPLFETLDLSSLRVVFTGGERVPTAQATRWEEATGSRVLQFYGSNEAGPFSCTSLDDDDHTRLTTAGRVVPGVRWQLLDAEQGSDDRGRVTVGQATLKGPGAHAGYWDDEEANAQLWTPDGFLILPDVVAIDADETVRVVGRKSDIIIRGGKNISAAVIEQGIEAHPAVRAAIAVPVPDPTFGERIGVAVVLHDHTVSLDLRQLSADLVASGVAKDHLPEHLRVIPEIPMSLGAKADKQRIKALFLS
jgi:acyl-CoA synthetase